MRYFGQQLFRVWKEPRRLIASVMRRRSKNCFHRIILLAGGILMFAEALGLLIVKPNLRDALPGLALIVLAIPLIYAKVWINAGLLKLTGRWLGGRGDINDTRTAAAYSILPLFWIFPFVVMLAQVERFHPGLEPLLIALATLHGVIGLSFLTIMLSEAHEFSAAKAVASIALSIGIVVAVIAALFGISSALPPILVLS